MSHIPLVPANLAHNPGVRRASCASDDDLAGSLEPDRSGEIFIGGNRLPARWQNRTGFAILETGFGAGLNFLLTWACWHGDDARPDRLHYVAVEPHPFSASDLDVLHARWPALARFSARLRLAWPPLVPGFHRLQFDGGRIVLTLAFGSLRASLPQIDAPIDAFYLDGAFPEQDPDTRYTSLVSRLDRLAAPGATLAARAPDAVLGQSLAAAGFVCRLPSDAGPRQAALTADFAPRWHPPARRTGPADRHAIVIGAGLAGSAACERLAARGWRITLVERHPQPAQETSGNLAGIVMPLLSRDDSPASRLARAAYLFTLDYWEGLGGIGQAFAGESCGVLQLARDEEHARSLRRIAAEHAYPREYARWLDPADVSGLLGTGNAFGGWLFSRGGWVQPASLCGAMLAACEDRVQRRFTRAAARLQHDGQSWTVIDGAGNRIAQAPVIILANGLAATRFAEAAHVPLQAVRGQVTHVPAASLPPLPVVVCGDGYLTRPAGGICSLGATYDGDDDCRLRQSSQQENLARLARMLPAVCGQLEPLPLAGRVGFRVMAPDRLPVVGALPAPGGTRADRLRAIPRHPGLHGLLGYGSRGLIWAPFAAELLASQLSGEPLPIERDLVAAVDPARFLLKSHRRGAAAQPTFSSLE